MKPIYWVFSGIVIFFILSIGVMASGNILKKPMGEDDRLLQSVKQLEQYVEDKQWDQANERSEYAMRAWYKIVSRIQYSVEREYMFEISGVLSRIKGAVKVEDDKATMEEIYYFYHLWENLGM